MQRFQIFLLFLICSMFMVLLQNGFNQTWDWPKIGLTLSAKSKNDIDTEEKLLKLKNLLNNRTSSLKIYLNTESDGIVKFMEDSAIGKNRMKGSHHHHKSSNKNSHVGRLPPIEMLAQMMNLRDRRNISRLNGRRRGILHTFDPLARFPVIDESKTPIRYVLLVSHFRAGSSFVGDLLQQNWKTFYSFEPLHLFQTNTKLDREDREDQAIRLLQNIYSCQFKSEANYVDWVRKEDNRFLFTWNRFLWSLCNIRRTSCFDSQFISGICVRSKYRVIKVTRLKLSTVEKLLQSTNQSIDLNVVYLVRDPRAIYNSRRKLEWCTTTPCGDYNTMCDDLNSDLQAYRRLVEIYGSRVTALRHEDISMDPFGKGHRLFDHLGLPFTSGVRRFLRINTEAKIPKNQTIDPYSVRRSSKQVILRWTQDLNQTEIADVQDRCKNIFTEFGYKPISFGSVDDDRNSSTSIAFEDILETNSPLPNSL